MPIIQSDIRRGRTEAQLRQLASGLTRVVAEAVGQPVDSIFLVVREMPGSTSSMLASTCPSTNPARMAVIWPEKNNCASARHAADPDLEEDAMPFIHVDLETGLTEEETIDLTQKIVEVTHDAIGSAVGHINVVIRDWPGANIVEAGRSLARQRAT